MSLKPHHWTTFFFPSKMGFFFDKQARYWKDFPKRGSVSGYTIRCVILEFNFCKFGASFIKSGQYLMDSNPKKYSK